MSGMMVLPVQGFAGDKKKKKKKKGKNNKHGGGDVHVNLIVDPSMFGDSARDEYGSDRDHDQDYDGSQVSSERQGGRKQAQQRRSQGLAMEGDWNEARRSLKRMLLVDIGCLTVWGGVFVLILFGKKCPPGGFNGW